MDAFKVGDVVLIKYDNTIGKVARIHQEKSFRGGLHDIKGLSGSMYPNQYAGEIEHIASLKNTELGRAIGCTLKRYPGLDSDFVLDAVS